MNFPKDMFPHVYEFHRIGESNTPEGREYMKNFQDQVDKEYSEVMDIWRDRFQIGGKFKIHKFFE